MPERPEILKEWASVEAIREHFRTARAELRELANEERAKLDDRESAIVAAFKAARSKFSRDRIRQKNKEKQRARRAGLEAA